MAARFRRRRSRGSGRRSSRKNRWNGVTFAVGQQLETAVTQNIDQWLSFWVKWPASMVNVDASPPSNQVPFNEPVDETLVRLYSHVDISAAFPGTTGVAPITNVAMGIIPFSGGENPEQWDFALFSRTPVTPAPPNPIDQIDDPWVWRSDFSNGSLETLQFSSDQYERNEWTRSMRKLPAGTGLLWIIGAQTLLVNASQPCTFRIGGVVRYLVKSGYSL